MDSYTDFAYVYDMFMDNVPYGEWADRIDALLRKYDELIIPDDEALKSEAHLLLDLGCGTGKLTRLMRDRGYDCIGTDLSGSMLEVAREHEDELPEDERILYLCQDMRELELYSTVGACISVCDSVNYLLSPEEVLKTFRLVNNYLYPHGLFIFDFNTPHYYRDELGDDCIAENRPEGSFIWENFYDEETGLNEYDLTIFRRDENAPGPDERFIRSEETHVQRGYEADEMADLITEAGMEIVALFDAETEGKVTADTCRVCMIARESGKEDVHI